MEEEGIDFDQAVPHGDARSGVHDAHAGAGGSRPFRRGPDRRASGTVARRDGHFARPADGAGPRESRTITTRVLHDGAGTEALAPRQRGFVAARRGVARHVDGALSGHARRTRCRSATSPTACTCRRGWRRRCSGSTIAIWDRTGTSTAANAHIWEGIENVDDGELWETHLSLKARLLEFVRRRAVEQAERRGESTETLQRLSRVLSPGCADHRVCAALRHLQARQSDSGRYRAAGIDGERSEASGAVRVCRQGASARRARQAGAAADRRVDARPEVRGQVRLRGGLRHQRGTPLRAGRGCVAEQSAAAAGGVGHQRAEGGAERRPESVGAGRLVGGGVRRDERLRHRQRAERIPTWTCTIRATARTCIACCATK